MEFKVEITPYADLQLLDILEYYLKSGNVQRTEKVEYSIMNAIKLIQRNPYANKVYDNTLNPNVNLRRCMVKHIHLILYEINGDVITISDIFDVRRNPEMFKY
jgi:plasmid stabilization system protein ParE